MPLIRKFIPVLIFLASSTFLYSQDSIMYQRDSVIDMEDNCTAGFFERSAKLSSLSKTILSFGKTTSMSSFMKANRMDKFADHGLVDLDNDGKNELVISNFTGGAHCCDEIYIFRPVATDKYQMVGRLFAGDVCIGSDNTFTYRFYQQMGYFFTCFACGYNDTSDAAPIPLHSIQLRYNKSKLTVVPGDKELRNTINDNLAKLGETPYERLEDLTSMDNGLRKEFAMNLTVYYYSFGRNLPETKKLFYKYYQFPDSKKVWAAFVKNLQSIKQQSNF